MRVCVLSSKLSSFLLWPSVWLLLSSLVWVWVWVGLLGQPGALEFVNFGPRDKLATLLWGDTSDERARHSLRQALMTLRQALPRAAAASLVEEGDTVGVNPATVEVDVALFERLTAEGTPEALERAAALYRGDLLEGISVEEQSFEDWLRTERERLREMTEGQATRNDGEATRPCLRRVK